MKISSRFNSSWFLLSIMFSISVLLSLDAVAGANKWTPYGPFGGSITSIAVSPAFATDHTIFVTTVSGVFKSTDGGANWTRSSTGITTYNSIDGIAISPDFANDHTLFVTVEYQGICRSTDGGTTWTTAYSMPDDHPTAIAISPSYSTDHTVYFGGDGIVNGYLYKSVDHGDNWTRLDTVTTPIENKHITSIANPTAATASTGVVFVGTELDGVFASTDSGATWTALNTGLTNTHVLSLAAPAVGVNYALFAGTSDAFYAYDQVNFTWVMKTTGITDDFNALAVSPGFGTTDNAILAATDENGIYLSINGGDNWTALNATPNFKKGLSAAFSSNFATDHTIFAGMYGGGIYKSTNTGTNWSRSSNGITDLVVSCTVISPSYATDHTVFAGTEWNGIFKTTDDGATWSEVDTGLTEMFIYSLAISPDYSTDNIVFAGTNGGGIFKTSNGGTNWGLVTSGTPFETIYSMVISPNYASDQTVFAGTWHSYILKTTTGGTSWTILDDVTNGLPTNMAVSALGISPSFSSDGIVFAQTEMGPYRTINGGTNWSSITGPTSPVSFAFSNTFASDHTVFAGGNAFHKSTDSGDTWSSSFATEGAIALSPNYSVDQTLYTTAISSVNKSKDGGTSWTALYSTGLGNYPNRILLSPAFASGTPRIFAWAKGSAGGLYIFDDYPILSTIVDPADGAAIKGTSKVITGTASAVKGLKKVEVSTDDGATWHQATGTANWSYTWTLPADEIYKLKSRATDNDTPSTVEEPGPGITVTVDKTNPNDISIISPSPDAIIGNGYRIFGSADDHTTGKDSGIPFKANVKISLDDGANWKDVAGFTGSGFENQWDYYTSETTDKTLKLKVKAIDRAGNQSISATAVTCKLDVTPPTSTITAPADGGAIKGTSFTITGTSTDGALGSGVSKVYVSTDNGSTWEQATGTTSWSYVWDISSLPDDSYTILSKAQDSIPSAALTETPGSGITVKIDNTAPSCGINPMSPVVKSISNIEGVADDGTGSGIAKVEVSVDDGATWKTATGTDTWSLAWAPSAEGNYSIKAKATDNAGNMSDIAVASITLDKTLPTVAVTDPLANVSIGGSTYTIRGTSSDSGSSVDLVEISINNGAWTAATPDIPGIWVKWNCDWDISGLADGNSCIIKARATDKAGNVFTMSTGVTVKINKADPISYITDPVSGQAFMGASREISGTASGANLSKVQVSTNGGTTWADATDDSGDGSWSAWSYNWNPLPADGTYTIKSRATNNANKVETPKAGIAIKVDNAIPTITVTNPPGGSGITKKTSYELKGTASDKLSSVKVVEFSFNGSDWDPVTGTTSWSYWINAGPGTLNMFVRATDNAGNVSDICPIILIIDNTSPTSTIGSHADNDYLKGTSCTISGISDDSDPVNNGVSDIAKVEISTDGGTKWVVATTLDSGGNWTYNWKLPADGVYTLKTRATDKAGNIETVGAGISVNVDKTAPTAIPTGSFFTPSDYTISGTAVDLGSGLAQVEVSIDLIDGGAWHAATGTDSWQYTVPKPADGIYKVKARATDIAGNIGAASTAKSFKLDATKPTITILKPGPNVSGSKVTISGTAADGAGTGIGLVEISTDGGTVWYNATGTASWSYTWYLVNTGAFTIKARATDLSGNVSVTSTLSVTVDSVAAANANDNTPPVVKITAPLANAKINTSSYTVTGTASDSVTGVKLVEVNDGTGWSNASGTTSWSYVWIPSDGGSWTIQCRGTDYKGNVSAPVSVDVTVDTTKPTATITSPDDGSISIATNIVGTCNDVHTGVAKVEVSTNDGVKWSAATLDVGGNSRTYKWSLPAEGLYRIKARATDKAGNVGNPTASKSIVVDKKSPVSSIESPVSGIFVSGNTCDIAGTATDGKGSGIQYVDISTDGTNWSRATDTNSWTYSLDISGLPEGSYTVLSRATDNFGRMEIPKSKIIIKLDQTAPTSNISKPLGGAVLTGTTATISGTANDSGGSGLKSVELSFDDGTTWFAAKGTATWSYTWTLPANGAYTVQSRAKDAAGNVETPKAGVSVTVSK